MKPTVEVFIYFERFTNIDLFHQGLYQIKSYMTYSDVDSQQQQGLPYLLKSPRAKNYAKEQKIEDCFYYSSGFIIRFQEEKVELCEGCVFRCDYLDSEIFINIELLFTEIKNVIPIKNTLEDLKLRTVAKAQLRITTPLDVSQMFFPIDFDVDHCCLLQTAIYSIPMSVKFPNIQGEDKKLIKFEDFLNKATDNYKPNLIDQFCKENIGYINNQGLKFSKYFKIQGYQDFEFQSPLENQSAKIQQLINQCSQQLFLMWNVFFNKYDTIRLQLHDNLKQEFIIKLKERYGESIFQTTQNQQDLAQPVVENHQEISNQLRNQKHFQNLKWDGILYLDLFCSSEIQPVVFKDVYIKENQTQIMQQKTGLHLFILVHGYQGHSFDMRLWRSALQIRYGDNTLILNAECNQENTDIDINILAQKLALEIQKWIKEEIITDDYKISLIGHSLGGLVIRAALPHLKQFSHRMNTLITLASPHLGYLLSSSALVQSGFWIIRKWKKCAALNQLCYEDADDYEKTFLYKLSQQDQLSWFQNVVFASSPQDFYVPYQSARIERSDQNLGKKWGKCYNEMINNLIQPLKRIHRLDVNFNFIEKYKIAIVIFIRKFDNMIGRAAHIQFIENVQLIRMIVYSFDDYFD